MVLFQVRCALWGEHQPTFTGNVAWRMLVPASKLPKDMVRPMSTIWWGPGKHFVHYYVRGGDYVNCVCVVEKSAGKLSLGRNEATLWNFSRTLLVGTRMLSSL